MTTYMTIGEFSRMTHLSVKALRHYHDVGLLEPHVDPVNSYRRYETSQVPAAHLIRRLRELDMPLADVRTVLEAPDIETRNHAVLVHLQRMEHELQRTRAVVASLRAMLEQPMVSVEVEHRVVGDVTALGIRARIDRSGIEAWCGEAFPDLYRAIAATDLVPAGVAGALYRDDYFEHTAGEVVAFVPVAGDPRSAGRAEPTVVPAATLAVAVHTGAYREIDRTYGALGTYVAANDIRAGGPIREHYLVGPDVTDDTARLRTEVCWPIAQGALR
jgi:DNA-binding transcriptional MerR regulator